MSESHFLPEALGPGCAFLDYDNDGWMDIFLVNSGPSDFWKPSKPVRNALYKNNRDGTFTDVTEKAGVCGSYFGMGVAVGDYDNDGWPDLFVTAYGRCTLYKNNHDGTFTDVTEHAGVATPGWTTSAVWFDYDSDGRLDLFVCSFVDYSGVRSWQCGNNEFGRNYYCVPRVFKPTASFLYHNNGDGTFTEVSKGQPSPKRSERVWASWPPTSTTTAGWTCLSPMTLCRISCSLIAAPEPTATGIGMRSPCSPELDSVRMAGPVREWAWMRRTSMETDGRTSSSPM